MTKLDPVSLLWKLALEDKWSLVPQMELLSLRRLHSPQILSNFERKVQKNLRYGD
jgi:hypothetical protein